MPGPETDAYPVGDRYEEVVFNLGALGTRNGKTVDSNDWAGAHAADYSVTIAVGFPWLDAAVIAPGAIQLVLQFGQAADPTVEPGVLTFTTAAVIAVVGGVWGELPRRRLSARYARINIVDTSNAANNGIYLVTYVRGH